MVAVFQYILRMFTSTILKKLVYLEVKVNFKMKDIVANILNKGEARLIIDKIQEELELENQKRAEFYEFIDEDHKAEFINGRMELHSPVKKQHTDATKWLLKLLDTYVSLNDLGYVGVEKTMISLTRNDYEPDICFFNSEKSKKFQKEQMLFPTPDFVAEVLSPNVNRDRIIKFNDYQEHGVLEYWIIDAAREFIEQYILGDEGYVLNFKAKEGFVESVAVQGFRISVRAIFDEKENLKALQGILKT